MRSALALLAFLVLVGPAFGDDEKIEKIDGAAPESQKKLIALIEPLGANAFLKLDPKIVDAIKVANPPGREWIKAPELAALLGNHKFPAGLFSLIEASVAEAKESQQWWDAAKQKENDNSFYIHIADEGLRKALNDTIPEDGKKIKEWSIPKKFVEALEATKDVGGIQVPRFRTVKKDAWGKLDGAVRLADKLEPGASADLFTGGVTHETGGGDGKRPETNKAGPTPVRDRSLEEAARLKFLTDHYPVSEAQAKSFEQQLSGDGAKAGRASAELSGSITAEMRSMIITELDPKDDKNQKLFGGPDGNFYKRLYWGALGWNKPSLPPPVDADVGFGEAYKNQKEDKLRANEEYANLTKSLSENPKSREKVKQDLAKNGFDDENMHQFAAFYGNPSAYASNGWGKDTPTASSRGITTANEERAALALFASAKEEGGNLVSKFQGPSGAVAVSYGAADAKFTEKELRQNLNWTVQAGPSPDQPSFHFRGTTTNLDLSKGPVKWLAPQVKDGKFFFGEGKPPAPRNAQPPTGKPPGAPDSKNPPDTQPPTGGPKPPVPSADDPSGVGTSLGAVAASLKDTATSCNKCHGNEVTWDKGTFFRNGKAVDSDNRKKFLAKKSGGMNKVFAGETVENSDGKAVSFTPEERKALEAWAGKP